MNRLQKRLTGIILVLIGVFICSNIYSLIPLYHSIGENLNTLPNEVAIGSTLFTFFYAFGLVFFGTLSDFFGRREIITFGLLLSAITTIFITFSSNIFELYFYRSIQGFTLASFAPAAFTYIFDIYNEKERTLWISLINAGFLAAGLIGQIISSVILFLSSWQFVFIIFSIVYVCFFVLSLIFLVRKPFTPMKTPFKQTLYDYKGLLLNRYLLLCYTVVLSILFSFVSFYESISYLLVASDGNSLIIRAVGLIGVFFSLFTGKLIKRFSDWKTLEGVVLVGWVTVFFLLFFKNEIIIAGLSIIFVASIAIMIPTIIHIIGGNSGKMRTKAITLYSFILLIGASLGSLIASLLPIDAVLLIILTFFTINFYVCLNLNGKEQIENQL